MARLALVPFYCGSRAPLLEPLAERLEAVFGLGVERWPPAFDPELAYDAQRGQYNSRLVLAELLGHAPRCAKVLGVTDVDLFIPVLTFVFGEAQLGGRAAVVSCHRLAPERYGLPANEALLETRLIKEATHELGHAYELLHCSQAHCVMASSTQVEGIDMRSEQFCPGCQRRLLAARG